ncbi:ATP-binding protein [Neobacillus sp. D3-1R]|uniref:ATP-binding protein n=1 Tax=Neobacillus sp. D3-1R TaxID=3445778 RepID=UPI003F9FE612
MNCENELSLVENILEQIECKLTRFDQELKDKKQYIDQTLIELNNWMNTNSYHQQVEKLAAGIVHEIRNPLTTVSGFLQLLKPYLKESDKERYADIAIDELKRANEIISEFLNASKPSEDKIVPLSINQLVKDIAFLYEGEALLHHIEISMDLTGINDYVLANPKKIKQVMINLVKNAIEAIIEGDKISSGTIQLITEMIENKVQISIHDNGCGMSKTLAKQLFHPFYTTKTNGTGIGLSMCKKWIEEHNGTILVESIEGTGTTFRIQLPVYEG